LIFIPLMLEFNELETISQGAAAGGIDGTSDRNMLVIDSLNKQMDGK